MKEVVILICATFVLATCAVPIRTHEELKADLKTELKAELKGELRAELMAELRAELKAELKTGGYGHKRACEPACRHALM